MFCPRNQSINVLLYFLKQFLCVFHLPAVKQTGITKNVLTGVSCKKHFAKPSNQTTALDLAALVNSLVLGSDKMQVPSNQVNKCKICFLEVNVQTRILTNTLTSDYQSHSEEE